MSLAELFFAKETFRTKFRKWRQACFRREAQSSALSPQSSARVSSHPSRFTLESLEPRVLLSATPTEFQIQDPGALVLVMDLLRPESPEAALAIVDQYAKEAPDILRRDFYNSLLAAFTEDEVTTQLARMNLTRLLIDIPDDRHWVVGGVIF